MGGVFFRCRLIALKIYIFCYFEPLFVFILQMLQELKKENFDLKLRLYMTQKNSEVRRNYSSHYTLVFRTRSAPQLIFFGSLSNLQDARSGFEKLLRSGYIMIYNQSGKITEKEVCERCISHCIANSDSTKTHSCRVFLDGWEN